MKQAPRDKDSSDSLEGPEVGRQQAREKNREFTECDKSYEEIHGSGRMRAKQKQGGASNVRVTRGDADGSSNITMMKQLVSHLKRAHGGRHSTSAVDD